jgi:hypothetical protein
VAVIGKDVIMCDRELFIEVLPTMFVQSAAIPGTAEQLPHGLRKRRQFLDGATEIQRLLLLRDQIETPWFYFKLARIVLVTFSVTACNSMFHQLYCKYMFLPFCRFGYKMAGSHTEMSHSLIVHQPLSLLWSAGCWKMHFSR